MNTLIRLFLREQSDIDMYCLLMHFLFGIQSHSFLMNYECLERSVYKVNAIMAFASHMQLEAC